MRAARKPLTCTLIAFVLAAASACGAGGASSDQYNDARAVLEKYLAATAAGDASACELESAQLARTVEEEADGLECAERVVELGKVMAGFDMDPSTATYNSVEGDEGSQVIDVTLSDGDDPTRFTLDLTDGAWVVSAAGLVDPGAASSGDDVAGSNQRWVESWCDLAMGMGADQASDVMGEPTSRDQESLEWKNSDMHFVAFLDAEGKVTDFWSPYNHSQADLASMSCVEENDFGVLQRIDE